MNLVAEHRMITAIKPQITAIKPRITAFLQGFWSPSVSIFNNQEVRRSSLFHSGGRARAPPPWPCRCVGRRAAERRCCP